MEEKNTICFLMGTAKIENKLFDIKTEINTQIYPNFDINNKEFISIKERCFDNILTTITALAKPNVDYNCNDTEFLVFTFSETEGNIIIRLIINEEVTRFLVNSSDLIKALEKNRIGEDLIELADIFIKCIGGKPNKELKSEIVINNLLNPNVMYVINIGFKDGELHSEFRLNRNFFSKPLSDDYIDKKFSSTTIQIAVDDISKSIQLLMLDFKDILPQNDVVVMITSLITKNKATPFNTDVAVQSNDDKFMNLLDEQMSSINIREALMYINRELLTF